MAAPYKSEDAQLGVGVESTQGTSVSPARAFGKIQEDASLPDPEQNWMLSHVVGGTREGHQHHRGQREFQGGDIPITLVDGAPLAYLLGTDTVTGSSAPYTHTITPKMNGLPPSQTIEAVLYGRGSGSNIVRTFDGCVPNSGELSISNDDELTVSLDYWGLGVSSGTSATSGISPPEADPWLFKDVSSSLSLFGTSFARVQDFSLTIENNLQEGRYLDDTTGVDPFEILYGNLGYSLEPTIRVTDNAIYNELTSPTAGGFEASMEFTRPNGNTLTITCTECQIESAPHDLPSGSDPIEPDVSITPLGVEITVEDSASTAYV
jgi:hypothetical protein